MCVRTDPRRKPMKRLSILVLAVTLMLPAALTEAAGKKPNKQKPVAPTCTLDYENRQCTVPLVAGQHNLVGEVVIDLDGDPVARFIINDPNWFITESHLYLDTVPPEKSAPGSFGFQHSGLDTQIDEFSKSEVEYALLADCLYVAAHAEVEKRCLVGGGAYDLEAFANALPDQVTFSAIYDKVISYFKITVSGGTVLDGLHWGWCIDNRVTLTKNTPHPADVYSFYEPLPDFPFWGQEDLDKVNWIWNQDFVGKVGACGEVFTAQYVQDAIWLVLGQINPSGKNACSLEIYELAEANGSGFIPKCGEYVGVLFMPPEGEQPVAIALPLTCDYEICGEETAWGLADFFDGPTDMINSCEFPKQTGWGTYFRCCSDAP
jgi:hypothetical protein